LERFKPEFIKFIGDSVHAPGKTLFIVVLKADFK